eukprot:8720571-Prorocentrum_lima.AAC.1
MEVRLEAGVSYALVVEGFSNESGAYELSVECASENDDGDDNLSDDAVLGIIVGLAVTAVAATALGIGYWCRASAKLPGE